MPLREEMPHMGETHCISWMPRWVATEQLSSFTIATGPWTCQRPHTAQWSGIGDGLRSTQQALRAVPVARIIAAIDCVSRRWLDRKFEPRCRSREQVVMATGFSAEAVERSFDVELRNYQGDFLERTLRRELGTALVLDDFQPDEDLAGSRMAIGPRITLGVFTGNVPGLPALSLVRALLVKSAVIAKVASGEPTFAARFVRTLADVEPLLGDAIMVTYWDRDDAASLRGALSQADAVIAYGSDAACAAIRAQVSPQQRYVEHGHKVSVGILARSYLDAVGVEHAARSVATDVSVFNQHACIAPQTYLVQGDLAAARTMAHGIAAALEQYAHSCPLGTLDASDAATLQLRRTTAAWAAATRPECDLWQAPGLDWTVVLEPSLDAVSGAGNRVLRVVPVRDMQEALQKLRPIAGHLQNIGLGALGSEFWHTAQELARMGACRISEPGAMAEPSMMWRHDGEPCVARLLRWCDIEMHRAAAGCTPQKTEQPTIG
jgi:hypothetical protein